MSPPIRATDGAWPGLFKVTEECGELLQVLGKIGAYPEGEHPDGKGPLRERLIDELGDVLWAIRRFAEDNDMTVAVEARAAFKARRSADWLMAGL